MGGNVTATFEDAWIDCGGIEEEVQKYFEELQMQKPFLTNGDLLMYKEADLRTDSQGDIIIPCMKGKYALYLYLSSSGTEFSARTIAPVGLLTTNDGYFAFGVMSSQTSLAGKILMPGGAIDLQDVEGNHVDIISSLKRELREEIGLRREDQIASVIPVSFHKQRTRSSLVLTYHVSLRLDNKELQEQFQSHQKNEQFPELKEIRLVPNDEKELRRLYEDGNVIEYLPGAVEMLRRQTSIQSWQDFINKKST